MGPTLTDGRTDEGSDPSRERDDRGVRQWLLGAATRLGARLLDAVGRVFVPAKQRAREKTQRDGGTEEVQSREAMAIRPSGQARLESGPARPRANRSTGHEDEPTVAAHVGSDQLRVYDTEDDEAYITSDVYKRVKR